MSPSGPLAAALEELRVTELVYEDFLRTSPLTETLYEAVREACAPGASLLVIGPNQHLVQTLVGAGYSIEVWRDASQIFETPPAAPVTLVVRHDQALPQPKPNQYDAILICSVLEHLAAPPAESVRAATQALKQSGVVILAAQHSGRLGMRLAGLRGQLSVAPEMGSGLIEDISETSWGWPAGPQRWVLSANDWRSLIESEGLELSGIKYTTGARPTLRATPMSLGSYLAAHGKGALKGALPGCRDYAVLTAALRNSTSVMSRPAWTGKPLEARPEEAWPLVSVVAMGYDETGISSVITGLLHQTYPSERLELIVAGPVTAECRQILTRSAPPESRWSQIMAMARGDVIAVLRYPQVPCPFWIEPAIVALGSGADVVLGGERAGNVFYLRGQLVPSVGALDAQMNPDHAAIEHLRSSGARIELRLEIRLAASDSVDNPRKRHLLGSLALGLAGGSLLGMVMYRRRQGR